MSRGHLCGVWHLDGATGRKRGRPGNDLVIPSLPELGSPHFKVYTFQYTYADYKLQLYIYIIYTPIHLHAYEKCDVLFPPQHASSMMAKAGDLLPDGLLW